MILELVIGITLSVLMGVGVAVWVYKRLVREAADTLALEQARASGRGQPPTLHPVIDLDKCIGSLSCLSVCPEGDILGVIDGKAALIDPSACIGHGRCALECGVDAITLVMGTETRGIDLPELSESFETSRPGVYIVGELGGMGLIKNAFTQGVQLTEHLGQVMSAGGGGVTDVVVVGAGPAGLATALGLKKAGLSFRVLEQESIGGTIAAYPRQKLVMSERVSLPLYGKFGRAELSKEELLEEFERAIAQEELAIEVGTKVQKIDGEDGAFVVHTSRGAVRARKVVLAVGRRGSPRKMGVPGEDHGKVTYRLIDPTQYAGKRVLVVGGGDAALEAAVQLAQETDADVSLSYRGAELGRAREANRRRFQDLVSKRRIRALMASTMVEVRPEAVILSTEKGQVSLGNDYVIACLGGELPTDFLAANGVSMRQYKGEALRGSARPGERSAKELAEDEKRRRFALGLFVLGAAIVGVLALVGQDYYHLPLAARRAHPAHAFLKPAGPWGHGVGIVATLVMMSNFLYSVRKRWGRLKGFRSIRGWLTFHQFVGFMSPLVIAFHAAFQSNNLLATLTTLSLFTVVATGVVGRFLYGLVPSGASHQDELAELTARYEALKAKTGSGLHEAVTDEFEVSEVFTVVTEVPVENTFLEFVVHRPLRWLRELRRVRGVRSRFSSAGAFDRFERDVKDLNRLRVQVKFYRTLKRLMSVWRVLHVVLAVSLVLMIAGHISVSLFLGYTWIFK